MQRVLAIIAVCVAAATGAEDGEKKTQPDPGFPPRVVETVPANLAVNVDFALRELKVTFDHTMDTRERWSFLILQNHGVYPGVRGGDPPRWLPDGRTCVLPIRLSPDTLYAIGFNSYRHTGFRNREGKIALPHAIVFRTRKAKGGRGEF